MVCIYREGRDIFSISVNYKHSLPVQQSCYRFLLAHFAEHLVVVAACKRLRDENDKIQGIEKYVSGLTNVEYTSFQLIASNQYLCCVKDFVNSICDHDLQYLSTEDFDEQKKYVLREYEYAGDSYQGSCNRFFYIMNGFEEIDVEKTLNNISFEELQNFIYENFSPSKCKVVYIGKHVNELQNVSLISNKIALNEPYKENFSSISSSLMKVFPSNKTEAWFGYRIPCISGMSDYIAHELVAKVIQIILHLSNKDEIENLKIINVGTHYTGRCPYSLYCVNTTFEKSKFEYQ